MVKSNKEIRVSELCDETASLYRNPADWHKLCEQFGIGDKENTPVKGLSGGERQRLFIVLALIPQPDLATLSVVALLWGVRLRGSLLAFLGSWALTMLSTQSIGMLAGDVAKDTKQASVIASILYFPMLIFSGTTLPIEVMPNAMQKIVSVFPLTQGLTIMKNTFLGISTGSTLLPICVMVGVAALCTILAVCFFRWE